MSIIKEISTASAHKTESIMEYDNIKDTIDEIIRNSNKDPKITLHTSKGIHIVNVSNIIRCSADDNYTNFHMKDGSKIIVSKTLKDYAELLENFNFFRTHQSHLINLDYVVQYVNSDGGHIVMQNGDSVLVSRRRKKQLLDTLMELYN